jgi:tRNA-dihydrouridine synthase B
MREPAHAASVIAAMARAVRIPVTVKMRAGWNEREINAPTLARMVEDAGAGAIAVHGRTAAQSYSGSSDWNLIADVASRVRIPVFGSGDCTEPDHVTDRLRSSGVGGVLVGRGVLRNPWILAQARALVSGTTVDRPSLEERGRFLLEYIDLLLNDRAGESEGFRHVAPSIDSVGAAASPARGRERWVINKLRALCAWYSKGLEGGGHLRVRVNAANSVTELRDIIGVFFFGAPVRSPSDAGPLSRPYQSASAPSMRPPVAIS